MTSPTPPKSEPDSESRSESEARLWFIPHASPLVPQLLALLVGDGDDKEKEEGGKGNGKQNKVTLCLPRASSLDPRQHRQHRVPQPQQQERQQQSQKISRSQYQDSTPSPHEQLPQQQHYTHYTYYTYYTLTNPPPNLPSSSPPTPDFTLTEYTPTHPTTLSTAVQQHCLRWGRAEGAVDVLLLFPPSYPSLGPGDTSIQPQTKTRRGRDKATATGTGAEEEVLVDEEQRMALTAAIEATLFETVGVLRSVLPVMRPGGRVVVVVHETCRAPAERDRDRTDGPRGGITGPAQVLAGLVEAVDAEKGSVEGVVVVVREIDNEVKTGAEETAGMAEIGERRLGDGIAGIVGMLARGKVETGKEEDQEKRIGRNGEGGAKQMGEMREEEKMEKVVRAIVDAVESGLRGRVVVEVGGKMR